MLFRVEDRAPFLTYSEGHWRLGREPLAQYSENSFTITPTRDATVSFNFYGTAVGFYGSKKPDQGVFRVSIDGRPSNPENATVSAEVYNVSLFTASNLPKGEHNVVLQNTGGRWRDLDYVTWDVSIGEDDEEVQVYTLQDSDPSFVYEPAGSWVTNPPFVEAYSGGNGHSTNVIGATARLKFRGDAIALYGPSGVEAAKAYSVRVDNRTEQTFSAAKFQIMPFSPKQLMYFSGNLGEGEHELTVTLNSLNSAQQSLSIDYVEIFTTESIGGTGCVAGGNSGSISSGSSSSSPPSTGLIVAVAITGALAVICLGLLLWIFVLVKKGKLTRPSKSPPPTTHHTTQFGQSFTSTPFIPNHTGNSSGVNGNVGHDSLYHRPDWGAASPTSTSPLQQQPAAFSDTATFTSSSSAQLPYTQKPPGAIRKARNEIPRTEPMPAPPPVYSDA